MKHTASVRKSSNVRGPSTRSRKAAAADRQFAVCVDKDRYEASLEWNKIYVGLPDKNAETDGVLRVVAASAEDYVFACAVFVSISATAAVKASLSKAT